MHAREYACTVMPPKLPPASSEEISRTMDGRLQAMLGWAERATDPAAADAKLTDWFGKWLKFHVVISFLLYGLLAAHVYFAIYFGLRWFE